MRCAWVVLIVAVAAGVGGGCSAEPAATPNNGPSLDGAGPESTDRGARTEEEWLALIEHGRRVRNGEIPAEWDPPRIDPDAALWPDCGMLPAAFHSTSTIHEAHPYGGTGGRTVMHFIDVSDGRGDGPEYYLILDWESDLSACDAQIQDLVASAVEGAAETDRYICGQVQRAADGRAPSDPSLRSMPVRVARAYLDAFCGKGGPVVPGGSPDDPGPPTG